MERSYYAEPDGWAKVPRHGSLIGAIIDMGHILELLEYEIEQQKEQAKQHAAGG